MKQKIIYLLSILFTIWVIVWILVRKWNVFAEQEPIQKILNQIQMNESELKLLEAKQTELNQWTAMLKEELLVKYWLQIQEPEVETDLSDMIYDENWNCIWWIWCSKDERTPWKLSEDGTHQEMPPIEADTEHEKFKELSKAYWLDASQIRAVENHYWITEWVILCITIAETSWWNRWYWAKNIWSVGSNDRWDRPTYALLESWLEDIGKTLTNRYLWNKKTLWCLSNAWNCKEANDNWKRYATSDWNRERNMTACLSTIYWKIDPAEFNIRR